MTSVPATNLLPNRVMRPRWQAPIRWRTRQAVRFDILMYRNFPLSLFVTGFVGLMTLVPLIVATLLLAKTDHRLAALPLTVGGPMVSGILLWLNKRLSHRTGGQCRRSYRDAPLSLAPRLDPCPGKRSALAAVPNARAENDPSDTDLAG